jgi:hypothetical protein
MGPFTKVAQFDMAKAVAHGMAGRYGWAVPIRMVVKPCDALLCGLFDLGKSTTHKSLLISIDST